MENQHLLSTQLVSCCRGFEAPPLSVFHTHAEDHVEEENTRNTLNEAKTHSDTHRDVTDKTYTQAFKHTQLEHLCQQEPDVGGEADVMMEKLRHQKFHTSADVQIC